jgi:hypothetical protein
MPSQIWHTHFLTFQKVHVRLLFVRFPGIVNDDLAE